MLNGSGSCAYVPPPVGTAMGAVSDLTRAFCAAAAAALLAAGTGTNVAHADENATLNTNGRVVFENNCAACHAGGGNVIAFARGKDLSARALKKYDVDTKDKVLKLVQEGKGAMPRYVGKISESDMEDVAEFVVQMSVRGWR